MALNPEPIWKLTPNANPNPHSEASEESGESYVVNVSAREGKFNKTCAAQMHDPRLDLDLCIVTLKSTVNCSYNSMCHPHTNMAKASLNMLTR